MTEVIIEVSIGCFLLLPYYMSIFLGNKQRVKMHVLFWVIFHMVCAGAGYLICGEWFNIATFILVCSILYYFFSYVFYVRDVHKKLNQENIERITNSKKFVAVSRCIMIALLVLTAIDLVLIFVSGALLYEKIYLSVVMLVSFVQCGTYLKLK